MFRKYDKDADLLIKGYLERQVAPLVWVGDQSPKIGRLLGLEGGYKIVQDGSRVSRITRLALAGAGGKPFTINLDATFAPHWVPDAPRHSFAIVGFFNPGSTPDDDLLRQIAVTSARQGEWRIVQAYDWIEVVLTVEAGDFKPLYQSEPVGFSWRPLRPRFINDEPSDWFIEWGLVDVQAELKGLRRDEDLLHKQVFCLTDREGRSVSIETDANGVERAEIVTNDQRRLPRRLVESEEVVLGGAGSLRRA